MAVRFVRAARARARCRYVRALALRCLQARKLNQPWSTLNFAGGGRVVTLSHCRTVSVRVRDGRRRARAGPGRWSKIAVCLLFEPHRLLPTVLACCPSTALCSSLTAQPAFSPERGSSLRPLHLTPLAPRVSAPACCCESLAAPKQRRASCPRRLLSMEASLDRRLDLLLASSAQTRHSQRLECTLLSDTALTSSVLERRRERLPIAQLSGSDTAIVADLSWRRADSSSTESRSHTALLPGVPLSGGAPSAAVAALSFKRPALSAADAACVLSRARAAFALANSSRAKSDALRVGTLARLEHACLPLEHTLFASQLALLRLRGVESERPVGQAVAPIRSNRSVLQGTASDAALDRGKEEPTRRNALVARQRRLVTQLSSDDEG